MVKVSVWAHFVAYTLCYISLSKDAQVATAADLVKDWNNALEANREIIKEANLALKKKLEDKEISPTAFIAAYQPEPQLVKEPRLPWGRWFLREYGWSLLSRCSDSQAWLPFNHPEMVQARATVRALFEEKGVHPCCLLNFDQLWRQCWSYSGKLLMKERNHMGKRTKRSKCHKRADKKLHTVKGNRRSMTVT